MCGMYFDVVRLAAVVVLCSVSSAPVHAGAAAGIATEWTQLLNNSELVGLVAQSSQQIEQQVQQIAQLSQQIQNQIKIYENMRQNTAQLPSHIWGRVKSDLSRLRGIVRQGQGIAFSMGNVDDVLKQRFPSFANFEPEVGSGSDFSGQYRTWSDTNRETISATLQAAGLTAEQFNSEEATMRQLRSMSQSSQGQMQALQVAHQIAAQQVAQSQKLRGLVSQQVTMMATWYQSEQAARDLAQARRKKFFHSNPPSTTGGQIIEPRW